LPDPTEPNRNCPTSPHPTLPNQTQP